MIDTLFCSLKVLGGYFHLIDDIDFGALTFWDQLRMSLSCFAPAAG